MLSHIFLLIVQYRAIMNLYYVIRILYVNMFKDDVNLTFCKENSTYKIYEYNTYKISIPKGLIDGTPRQLTAKIGQGIVVLPSTPFTLVLCICAWFVECLVVGYIKNCIIGG